MTDLLGRLQRYGNAFESAASSSMPTPDGEPLIRRERAMQLRRSRRPLAAIAVAAAVVAIAVIVAVDDGGARVIVSTDSVVDEVTSRLPVTAGPTGPFPTSPEATVSPSVLPTDSVTALAQLPHYSPGWVPDGGVERPRQAFDHRNGADGWVQLYVSAPRGSGRVVLSSAPARGPSRDLPEAGAYLTATESSARDAEEFAAAARLRANGDGWDIDPLPAGYRLLAEGQLNPVGLTRTWQLTDDSILTVSVFAGLGTLAAPSTTEISEVVTRGDFIGLRRWVNVNGDPTLIWSPQPGVVAAVTTTDAHVDDQLLIAEGLGVIDDDAWRSLISTAELDAQSATQVLGGDPNDPTLIGLVRYLPDDLPYGLDPLEPAVGYAEPAAADGSPNWEQTWIGNRREDPPVVTATVSTDPLPDGPRITIGGRDAVLEPNDELSILSVENPAGGITRLFARRLTTDELTSFAAALQPRTAEGFDTSGPLPAGLESFSIGPDHSIPGSAMLGWSSGARTLYVSTANGPKGSTIRPGEAKTLERIDLGGIPALLLDSQHLAWYLANGQAIRVTGRGFTKDELATIARGVHAVDNETWNNAWDNIER